MKIDKSANLSSKYNFEDFKNYADKHNCVIVGEYRICRVISNTRYGRKDSVCAVVRAFKKGKDNKMIFGNLVGLREIDFKPDCCRYVFLEL